jgi:hypothetical protein
MLRSAEPATKSRADRPDRPTPPDARNDAGQGKASSSVTGLAASLLVIAIVTFAVLAILDAFARAHGLSLGEAADNPAGLSHYARVVRAATQNAIVVIDEGD